MIIVPQSVSLLWVTPNPVQMIEKAGRVAYKSEEFITEDSADKFVRQIIKSGHGAVIEHACASLYFVTERGVSHEIVRHRLFSYVQESTRYCNYSKDKFGNQITVVKPPTKAEEDWKTSVLTAEQSYFNMLAKGDKAQIARSVLPTCLKTEIVVTGNFREWRHFLMLRTAPAAHPQMVELAKMAESILREQAPAVFENIENKNNKL